ncbi:8424_t:CDS:2, partial [Entrophospora sp. SA101]
MEGPPPTPLDTQELFECLKNLLPKDNVEIPCSIELSSSYASTTTTIITSQSAFTPYNNHSSHTINPTPVTTSPNKITSQSAFTPYNNHSSHTINPTPVTTSPNK